MALNTIPVSGRPGIFDPRNPTLVPNFDKSVASSGLSTDLQSPALFLQNNPRGNATATATVGGTVTTGDVIPLVISNGTLPNGQLAVEYTVQGGDTLSNIAEQLAKLFNDSAAGQAVGLEVDAVGPVLTFNWPGKVGNSAVLSKPSEGPITVTMGGTARTGDRAVALFTGAGIGATPIAIAINITTGQTATQMGDALATAINGNSVLSALGISALDTAGAVAITIPGAAEPVTITSYVNNVNPNAIVIGGTITAGDALSITITDASLPGSPITLPYTVKNVDTTQTIAAAFAALINGNSTLAEAGITALVSSSTINVTLPDGVGQLRWSRSVGGGTETITLPTTPTTTAITTAGASETITLSPLSGALSGGTGPIIPVNNFQWHYNGAVMNFKYGQPEIVGDDLVAKLVAGGAQIV